MKFITLSALLIIFFSDVAFSYNWKGSVDGFVSRCFEAENVKVRCEDLSEPEWGRTQVGELEISAVDYAGRRFFYSYEKGIPGSLCQEHLAKIEVLLEDAKEACITGAAEWKSENEEVINSKWRALETGKGRVEW